jgi:hypothetical protein
MKLPKKLVFSFSIGEILSKWIAVDWHVASVPFAIISDVVRMQPQPTSSRVIPSPF